MGSSTASTAPSHATALDVVDDSAGIALTPQVMATLEYHHHHDPDFAILSEGRPSHASFEWDHAKPSMLKRQPTYTLYMSIFIASFQTFQFGWSLSQLNNSQYHDPVACKDPQPVTCIMFPGHSTFQWSVAVNAWIVGGMLGALTCGAFAQRYGRRTALLWNALILVSGGVLQALAPTIYVYAAGRFVAGIGSGAATATVGGYVSEISPPQLRGKMVVVSQLSVVLGTLLVSSSFFIATTEMTWRLATFVPVAFATLFLVLAPMFVVESPCWLLSTGQPEAATAELKRLFGDANVPWALAWMQDSTELFQSEHDSFLITTGTSSYMDKLQDESSRSREPSAPRARSLFDPYFRRQLFVAIGVATAQQLTGINGIFYYSSDIFRATGIVDARVGGVIVSAVNVLPVLVSGMIVERFQRRSLLLGGMVLMLVGSGGMVVALYFKIQPLIIACAALYVVGFGVGLGPLVWGILAELFPDSVRAQAMSVCMFLTWSSNLLIGVSYPILATSIGTFAFLPFVGTVAFYMVFIYVWLPETSGKTKEQIQSEFHMQWIGRDKRSSSVSDAASL